MHNNTPIRGLGQYLVRKVIELGGQNLNHFDGFLTTFYETLFGEEKEKRPDFCLGFEKFHIDEKILQKIKKVVEKENYTADYNQPFKGSIIPQEFYKKNKKVKSLMIEINKRTYLKNNKINPKNINKIKKTLKKIIEIIEKSR